MTRSLILTGALALCGCAEVGQIAATAMTDALAARLGTPERELQADADAVIFETFDSGTVGVASGVRLVATPTGRGAAFTRSLESRIEYPAHAPFPTSGTLEWRVRIESGYGFSRGDLTVGRPNALLFTTTGPDTWYVGSAWVTLHDSGRIDFAMSDNFGGTGPLTTLTANDTAFRFGTWHTVGVSYGSAGRSIAVDGAVVARDGLRLRMANGGGHRVANDLPTIGEMLSRFPWPNDQHDSGFEGVVDTFRASRLPSDFRL